MSKKFYCNSKIYNTARAERVFDYNLGKMHITLYKNIKFFEGDEDEWFYVFTEGECSDANRIDEKYVKNILLKRNRGDLCEKYGLK